MDIFQLLLQGFATAGTPINLLIALDPKGSFLAVKLLSHHEPVFLEGLGEAEPKGADSCTTHLTVCDQDGMMVAMTTTLLSSMGSRVVLPRSGVLMNNGVMWFDPRPGQPNSIAPGKRPLSSMTPTIVLDGVTVCTLFVTTNDSSIILQNNVAQARAVGAVVQLQGQAAGEGQRAAVR